MVKVRVRLPPSNPVVRPDSRNGQSSQNGSDDNLTPFPSAPRSVADKFTVPRCQFSFRFSPDTALPSTENPSANETTYRLSTSSTSAAQVSSSSPATSGPDPEPENADREEDTISALDAQLKGLRFPSTGLGMDMTRVADALQTVAAGRDSSSSHLLSPTPPLERLSARRRRSSSRNNLEKHDVRDEAPPNDRFNLPAVQNALRDTKGLMYELIDVLGSSVVHNEPDSVMKRLHRQAEELAEFKCPSTRIVGFVGDSGAGKSSLLNSLLDDQDLARSSNSGGACTCVVTEFHHHQDENFTVEVDRFSETELMPQLEDLLRDYRHFRLNRDSMESHELADFEKRAKLASDTFQALFHDHFVGRNILVEEIYSKALSTLRSWVQGFDQSIIQQEYSGLNLNECSALLTELTSDTASSTATIWPWVKKIKVYSNAHILSKGLVLVDLPGLRDLNSARRNITERYLLKCDEIFVVAIEGRATTDEGVQSVIELAKKARLSNVGIICTRSDEIKPTEALRDWKGKGVSKEIQRILKIIEQQDSEIKGLEGEVSLFDDIDEDDLCNEERDELSQLNRKLRSTRKRRSEHEFDLQKLLITTRNEAVKNKLVTLYKHEVPGNLLKVFCASNTIYWDHRDAPRDRAIPYLNLSGILAIRENCMTMVSESQYMAATKYMRNDIRVLLGELDLWVQSGQGSLSAEKKKNIRSVLDTVEKKLYLGLCGRTSALNNAAGLYKNEFNVKVYQPQGSHVSRWRATAKSASTDWSCWFHQTYSAFCRNYGTHYTAAVGSRSWNQEIIEEMIKDMDTPWDEVQMSLDKQGEDIIESIDGLFDWVDQFLDTELVESPDTACSLISTLLSQQQILEADMEAILNDLQGDLRTLRTDAMSSIRTSFVGRSMENTYTNARLESGKGSDARRKAIINSAVNRHDLFADLLKSFKSGFNSHVDKAQERIRETVGSNFNAIKDTLEIVRSDNVALESEMDPEFRGRVECRIEVTKKEMGRVYSTLAT
ncbi:hypothetical protein F4859DRAFT_494186 [Xylaria cf. heliscus]|nr:hypothetical protein F4859DRAFT_494186 [Xylaria cf. heliscus]